MHRLIIFLLSFFPLLLLAQINTDRPTQSESSALVLPKQLQLELGSSWQQAPDLQAYQLPSFSWRYGLIKGLELRALGQLQHLRPKQEQLKNYWNLSGIQLGTKMQLFSSSSGAAEGAWVSQIALPIQTYGGASHWAWTNKLAFSHQLNSRHNLAYNLGSHYAEGGQHSFSYTLCWSYSLAKGWTLFLEPYGQFSPQNNPQLWANTGLIYLLNNNLQLDCSFGLDLQRAQQYFIGLGLSSRFFAPSKAKEDEED